MGTIKTTHSEGTRFQKDGEFNFVELFFEVGKKNINNSKYIDVSFFDTKKDGLTVVLQNGSKQKEFKVEKQTLIDYYHNLGEFLSMPPKSKATRYFVRLRAGVQGTISSMCVVSPDMTRQVYWSHARPMIVSNTLKSEMDSWEEIDKELFSETLTLWGGNVIS